MLLFYLCLNFIFIEYMGHEPVVIKNTKILQLMVKPRYRLLRHVVLLLGVFILIFCSGQFSEYAGVFRYYRLFFVYIVMIITFYVNMNILVPRFFFKNQYIIYVFMLLSLVLIALFTMRYFMNNFFDPMQDVYYDASSGNKNIYQSTISIGAVILVTTMIKLFQRWVHDNERITELNNITLTMELTGLRNQINPHFLFNMLNGIKALVRTDQEKAVTIIMKLSEFLRYQLYENNEEKILLKSEINFLTNFLDLEKLRRDNLLIYISPSKDDPSVFRSIFIPPNLFTTFVENAVKHSVNIAGEESYIKIDIVVEKDKLYFTCINSIDAEYIPSKGKNNGLGLTNIKRRLELLYGEDHSLEIDVSEKEYNVKLIIPL